MPIYTIIGGVNGSGRSSLTGVLKTLRTDLGVILDVDKLAAAHGGTAEFFPGDSFRCELRLPLSPRGKGGAHRGRG